MKVRDLKAILEQFDDNVEVEIAATPDQGGWTNDILPIVHSEETKIVLALSELSAVEEEQKLVFRDKNGNVVRPV